MENWSEQDALITILSCITHIKRWLRFGTLSLHEAGLSTHLPTGPRGLLQSSTLSLERARKVRFSMNIITILTEIWFTRGKNASQPSVLPIMMISLILCTRHAS